MISPSTRSAMARPSALLPEAVGPSTARTIGRDTFGSRLWAFGAGLRVLVRLLVVIERHRKQRFLVGILGWKRLGGVGSLNRVHGGPGERLDFGGPYDLHVGDRAGLVDVELQDHAAAKRHRGLRYEPVAAHLRDEAADPGAELDTLRVELDRRPRILIAALRIVERLLLDIALQVAHRVAEHSSRGGTFGIGWPRKSCRRLREIPGNLLFRLGRLRRLGRLFTPGTVGVRRFGAFGRIATRIRKRILRVRRLLGRLRFPVGVRQFSPGRRNLCRDVQLRLDEYERPIARLFELPLLLLTGLQFLCGRLKQSEPRPQDEGREDQYVDDDAVGNRLPAGHGAADDELVLVPFFEIEVNQRTKYTMTSGFSPDVEIDDAKGERDGANVGKPRPSQDCHELFRRRKRAYRRGQVGVGAGVS